jgi:hypothetical protein
LEKFYLWGALGKLFERTTETVVTAPVKVVTGAVTDVSGTANDVTEIRKDIVETKLAEKHLADEGSLIVNPQLGDVAKYDPKAKRIIREAGKRTTFVFWERAMAVTVLYAIATVLVAFSDEVHAILPHIRALLGK